MHMQWKEHLPPIEVPVKILCHLGPGNQSWFECHYTFLILKDISEKTPQGAFLLRPAKEVQSLWVKYLRTSHSRLLGFLYFFFLSAPLFSSFFCTSGFLSVSTVRSLWLYLSLSLPPSPYILCRSVCLPRPSSFSLTSVKCNWRSSLHMAHRHRGDIVCAVAANCSPCSSEPIPLLHFSPPPPPLFVLCPYSHYFISQPSPSLLSSSFHPVSAVLFNYSIFPCSPQTS